MAYYIRIDEKEDYDWLVKIINNWLAADPNDPKLQLNYIHIFNWFKYLENKVSAKEAKEEVEAPTNLLSESDFKRNSPKPAPPKRRGRPPSVKKKIKPIQDPVTKYECAVHKTYYGKRRPQHDCEKCWSIYKLLNPMTYKKARTDFERARNKKAESSSQ